MITTPAHSYNFDDPDRQSLLDLIVDAVTAEFAGRPVEDALASVPEIAARIAALPDVISATVVIPGRDPLPLWTSDLRTIWRFALAEEAYHSEERREWVVAMFSAMRARFTANADDEHPFPWTIGPAPSPRTEP